jgi:hypothetical protein
LKLPLALDLTSESEESSIDVESIFGEGAAESNKADNRNSMGSAGATGSMTDSATPGDASSLVGSSYSYSERGDPFSDALGLAGTNVGTSVTSSLSSCADKDVCLDIIKLSLAISNLVTVPIYKNK